MLMCYHDNMITHKTDFVNPHSYIGEISSFVTKSFWASINYLILANYSKVQFYKNSTNSLALSHLGHSNSFASCKALCVLISASLPKTHFHVKGCVCLVGSASCRAFGHTRPASVPGLSVGLPPSPSKDACNQSHTVAARCGDTND